MAWYNRRRRGYSPTPARSVNYSQAGKCESLHFDSVDALLQRTALKAKERGCMHYSSTDDEFVFGRRDIPKGGGFRTYNQVVKKASEYWQEGLDVVQGMLHELSLEEHNLPQPKDRRRRRCFNEDSGDEVDYDRLRAGQPYWEEARRETVAAPQFITLVSDLSTSCGVDSEKILWRGAVTICLCDLLEKRGYRVDAYACNYVAHPFDDSPYDEMGFISVKVKEGSAPVDIPTLTNALSGWFFRSAIFQAYYCFDSGRTPSSGLGAPTPFDKELPQVKDLSCKGEVTVIDNVWSLRDALAKVRAVITTLNKESEG